VLTRLTGLFDANPWCQLSALLVDRRQPRPVVGARAGTGSPRPAFGLIEFIAISVFNPPSPPALPMPKATRWITMDADLQDPPEIIPALVASGARVPRSCSPFAVRVGNGIRRQGWIFFTACSVRVADYSVEANTGTFA